MWLELDVSLDEALVLAFLAEVLDTVGCPAVNERGPCAGFRHLHWGLAVRRQDFQRVRDTWHGWVNGPHRREVSGILTNIKIKEQAHG